jgi:glycine cleavage system transcriptional repressor
MQQLVISAVGPDRPGLVDHLAQVISDCGGNIADSRMVNLGGQFAMVMEVEIPEDNVPDARERIPDSGRSIGMTVTVCLAPAGGGETVTPGVPYRIRTYSMDQQGIVHRITHQLHRRGVNIEELQTRLEHAAHSGAPLFGMDMVVTVPQSVSLKDLRDDLESLCDEMNCDLDIQGALQT